MTRNTIATDGNNTTMVAEARTPCATCKRVRKASLRCGCGPRPAVEEEGDGRDGVGDIRDGVGDVSRLERGTIDGRRVMFLEVSAKKGRCLKGCEPILRKPKLWKS